MTALALLGSTATIGFFILGLLVWLYLPRCRNIPTSLMFVSAICYSLAFYFTGMNNVNYGYISLGIGILSLTISLSMDTWRLLRKNKN